MDIPNPASDVLYALGAAVVVAIVVPGLITIVRTSIDIHDSLASNRAQYKKLLQQTDSPWSQEGMLINMKIPWCNWANDLRLLLTIELVNKSTFEILVTEINGLIHAPPSAIPYAITVDYLPGQELLPKQGERQISAWWDLPPGASCGLSIPTLRDTPLAAWRQRAKIIIKVVLDVRPGRSQQCRRVPLQLVQEIDFPRPPYVPTTPTS